MGGLPFLNYVMMYVDKIYYNIKIIDLNIG